MLEFKYLNNCLDCMEYMDQCYDIDLDCSDVSLEVIDILFKNANEAYKEESFDNLDVFVDMFSGYVGMVFKNAFGGNFIYDETGEALNVNTNHIYISQDVRKCITENLKISDLFKQYQELL